MTHLACLLSGLLLFLSDHPTHWWALQFVALAPFFWAVHRQHRQRRPLWPLGLLLAASNALPLVAFAGFAPPILASAAAMLVQWPLIAMACGRVIRRHATLGPLAAAAIVTLAEVLIWYAVPIFGTAQCFARPLSAAPEAIAFIAFTGVGGLIFALAACQALVATAASGQRPKTAIALVAAVLAIAATCNDVRWSRPLGPSLRCAAAGWDQAMFGSDDTAQAIDNLFDVAAQGRAALLVTPEAAFDVGIENKWLGSREQALATLTSAARKYDLTATIGLFSNARNDNRIWFLEPADGLVAEYSKSHLIPWLEDYTPGNGTLVTATAAGQTIGGMICQDDNFTDLGRSYGRDGVPLVAVPTNDWPDIREYHLENGIFRAIENGYAIVRAASNGISALITPRGEVLMRHDHIEQGPSILITDLPTGDRQATVYARLGDWPICVLATLLLLLALRFGRRPDGAPDNR